MNRLAAWIINMAAWLLGAAIILLLINGSRKRARNQGTRE